MLGYAAVSKECVIAKSVNSIHGKENKMIITCDCGKHLTLEVLKSAAGYYLGYFCPNCGPYSRVSGYFNTEEQAELAINN